MFKISKQLPSGKQITFTPLNPRVVALTGKPAFSAEKVHADTRKINAIIYEDSLRIEVGDVLNLSVKQDNKKEPFKVRYITERKNGGYLLLADKRTDTSIFLLPLLGNDDKWFMWYTYFINAYVNVDKKFYKEKNEDKLSFIYLLYRFSSNDEFLNFESKIKAHTSFVRTIEPDPHHTMFVMSIPKDREEDYQLILQGKYSEIDNKTKRQIISFHDVDVDNIISQILIKGDKRKEQLIKEFGEDITDDLNELYRIMDIKEETYRG